MLASIALGGCKKETSKVAPMDLAKIESITWTTPDADSDGVFDWLQADVLLRLPPGAQCVDGGTALEHPEGNLYLVTADRLDRVQDPSVDSDAGPPWCVTDAQGRCTLKLAFNADSIASRASDGRWVARLKLAWRLPKVGGSYASGDLDSLVQTPSQRVALYRHSKEP